MELRHLYSNLCLARRRSLSCAIELMRGSARLTTPPSGKSSTGSASARIEELIAAYRRGPTAAALAVQFQIHRSTVAALLQRQNRLKELGLSRERSRRMPDAWSRTCPSGAI